MKEFAPVNSFFYEFTPLLKHSIAQESKQNVTNVAPLYMNDGEMDVYPFTKIRTTSA